MPPVVLTDTVLDALLADDVPIIDLTTEMLGISAMPARMSYTARQPMVVALAEEAARLLGRQGCVVTQHAASGEPVAEGSPILTATGPAGALHRAWKVGQTMIEVGSGIASATRAIVDAARAVAPDIAIACTRKSVPGAKALSIKAIMAGGAVPHRLGLSETILLFEEHRRFLTGVSTAEIVRRLRQAAEKKVVIEVADIEQGVRWALAGADVIQAEKFTPPAIAALVDRLRSAAPATQVAAAGGINAANAAPYAAAGAHVLVTSSPYTAKPLDVKVHLTPVA